MLLILHDRWKQKLAERKKTAMITKETNKILVHNILPVHVADLYLSRQFRNDFYSEEYENVAVMFATIMNYETSSSNTIESENKDLLKLNQIICAFDETLMSFSRDHKIEKIKVAGWSYMCACGLDPGRVGESQGNTLSKRRSLMSLSAANLNNKISSYSRTRKLASVVTSSHFHTKNIVVNLVSFALELMRVLKRLSEASGDDDPLKLRVGISNGRVMAGVIGLSKPLYDIWGNSVNLASRMDSTGQAGQIHVTEETATALQAFGIKCKFRGETQVKGKGLLPTYFVSIDEDFQFEKEENDLIV
jgi:adenylate cyclase